MKVTAKCPLAADLRVRLALARFSLLAAMLTLVAVQASAMSIRELRALEASDKEHGAVYVEYYLIGVMEGVLEANAHAARSASKPTVCLNSRRIEPRMARSIYDGELRRNAGLYEVDMPVELVMRSGLTVAYAC